MRKCLSVLLVLCLLFGTMPLQADAEELLIAANPYGDSIVNISTPEEFLRFAQNCILDSYSIGKTVFLEADIDLTGREFAGIPIFCGTFNGNGHRISGLNITVSGSQQGLFRTVAENAEIRDLHVEGSITPGGSGNKVGGIAGTNAGTISGCTFGGTVSGVDNVGGIAGSNTITGIIEDCSVTGSVHGSHFIGGIAGESSGVIRCCENRADVNTTIEQNSIELEDITLESLTNSESAATVTDIGGICGTGIGVIRDCRNLGNIGYPLIGYNVGGIAGSHSGYIYHCTNEGNIKGRKEVGGIIGQLEPAVSMAFEEDTLQILQGQMDTMAALTDRTASNAQAGASALESQMGDLEAHVNTVQNALDTLIPDEDDPQLPDPDAIMAAQNALSGSMSAITGTLESMGTTGESTLNTAFKDIQALSDQMNVISGTLGAAEENISGSVADVSDYDTDEDTTAKILDCKNLGTVNADRNAGGIVGAISLENDLDPESDLQIFGNTSINFACELRAVIAGCENSASVTGKKQNTGGIVGWMSMGLAKNCINAGAVTGGDYTGGIAGLSVSYIRSCIARCFVSGDTLTGGIAGMGSTVTDCNALVQLKDVTEKYGAILGGADDKAALETNYYLPVNGDIGAVDGISYEGKAQAMAAQEFFAQETLPEKFHYMTVTFHFEDGTDHVVTVPFASKLAGKLIPEIPPVPGYESAWVGIVKITDQLFFDTDFTVSRTAHIPTLASVAAAEDGRSILLAQGDFQQDDVVSIAQADGLWQLSLPKSTESLHLRFLLPDTHDADSTVLLLQSADGNWADTPFELQGSYLVFTAAPDTTALQLQQIPVNYTPYILIAAGVLVLIILALILLRKRKTK